ncbi:MAG: YfiT family bacillithiol transferase [Bacillota bacterium]
MEERYPIGIFEWDGEPDKEKLELWIKEIEDAPQQLRKAVAGLSDQQLDTAYRSGGWTVRQVVHHLPDSHLNSYIRFKLALTEENPAIKPYQEDRWAELTDSRLPIEVSMQLLDALHERWVALLRTLDGKDLEKTFYHPDSGEMNLAKCIGLYAWHGKHHLSHITELRRRRNW